MSVTLIDDVRVSKNASRNIRKTVLSNGLMVLTESMPHVRSVSMGAWIGSGSRDEAIGFSVWRADWMSAGVFRNGAHLVKDERGCVDGLSSKAM